MVRPVEKQHKGVIQPWVQSLTFMQQSVLITAVRGPDTLPKYHVTKYLIRWYRRSIMLSAFDHVPLNDPHDPRGGSFLGPIGATSLDQLASDYLRSIDEIPLHFHLHFVHAAEILGYKHPDPKIRAWWYRFYLAAARDMHLNPESEAELDQRLGDSLDDWQRLGGETEPITGRLSRAEKQRPQRIRSR